MTNLEAAVPEFMGFDIFAGIPRPQLLELCANGQVVTSNHRDHLIRAGGEAAFFGVVLSGAYKISKPSAAGDDVIVHFSTPGDVIGAFIMAQPRPIYPVSAIAMGPSRFLKLPRENYVQQWKKNPDLIFRVQNLLSVRMGLLQDQKVMAKAPLIYKVAALLIALLEKHPTQEGLVLPLPLTRKEIADTLGASVESVIRVMSEWSKLGIIETNDQLIRVIKPDKVIAYLKMD